MDSIMEVHYAFLSSLSVNSQLKIELRLVRAENEKLMLSVDFLTNDNTNLKLQNKELHTQLEIKDKMHENDEMYWKQKAKGKFKSFLLGTGLGALVIAILTLI
jgi:hypothetical protein